MINIDFWQGRYENKDTPWDLGGASPHFEQLLSRKPDFLEPAKMAVFGSGRGHDAALFAKAGFEVIGFDYAPGAIEEATQLYGNIARFEQANLFELAEPASPWAGQFNYILEHTCFCAILPKERQAYVQSVLNLLKPGGYLIGVFWEHNNADGPPFSTTQEEINAFFGQHFETVLLENHTPVSDREGIERLTILRRNDLV